MSIICEYYVRFFVGRLVGLDILCLLTVFGLCLTVKLHSYNEEEIRKISFSTRTGRLMAGEVKGVGFSVVS